MYSKKLFNKYNARLNTLLERGIKYGCIYTVIGIAVAENVSLAEARGILKSRVHFEKNSNVILLDLPIEIGDYYLGKTAGSNLVEAKNFYQQCIFNYGWDAMPLIERHSLLGLAVARAAGYNSQHEWPQELRIPNATEIFSTLAKILRRLERDGCSLGPKAKEISCQYITK